uniref:Uncharacterized protein n=1 Tax=Strombidium inclinatum TaxID=197538 RepID=A0A7S3IV93_9SPIT
MGGMGMGGMYGNQQQGMMGKSFQVMQTMQMFVYQICETGQMVSMNSPGLLQFFQLLKKTFSTIYGKIIAIGLWLFTFSKAKSVLAKNKVTGFVQDYLLLESSKFSKDQLETQLLWLQRMLFVVMAICALVVCRKFAHWYKYGKFL